FRAPPPDQITPLFPYTTLFRSEHGVIQHLLRIRPARIFLQGNIPAVLDRYIDAAAGLAALREAARLETLDQRAAGARVERVVVEDRKSTRLNSSHDQISYAVFC